MAWHQTVSNKTMITFYNTSEMKLYNTSTTITSLSLSYLTEQCMVALDLSTKHVGHSLGSCGVSGEGFSETGPS